MKTTFTAYVDESGDEGFTFGRGSSDWFVLSAVVTRTARDLNAVKCVDTMKGRLGKPLKKPLHVRRLDTAHKAAFVDLIARADVRVMSVLVHKPSLNAPETFMEPNVLYFYTARYLVERLSWYCRDNRRSNDGGDGTVRMIFGKRDGMPYVDMRAYIDRLQQQAAMYAVQIDWRVIKSSQVEAERMGRYRGLQIADAIAHSFFCAVDQTRNAECDHDCALRLKPVVYHRYGKYFGYGIKIFPKQAGAEQLALVRSW